MVSLVYSGVTFKKNTRSKYNETHDHFKVQLKVVLPYSGFVGLGSHILGKINGRAAQRIRLDRFLVAPRQSLCTFWTILLIEKKKSYETISAVLRQ